MDARKEGLLLKTLFSDQVRTYAVGVGSGLGMWAALRPGIILCVVSWLGSPSLPGVWVLRYCSFVLAGDMSDKITKVAKDTEVQPVHNLGPGMRVVWGGEQMYPRLILSLESSCFHLLSTGIADISHHPCCDSHLKTVLSMGD